MTPNTHKREKEKIPQIVLHQDIEEEPSSMYGTIILYGMNKSFTGWGPRLYPIYWC
ncbi:hypothetical protein MTR_2g097940 [Medicago truncatula]|uniref:Uncharacterized protein n=1 Tax=Medicago truncatula TaxID=3880 RepID=G7IUB2_MEDTR|nr:hypothetical protein MTR_2g097940 [Medicago truncatula]